MLYAACAFVLAGACEDKLDIRQKGVTSMDNFYKTDQDAQEAISAVYAQWRANSSPIAFIELLSDDLYAGGGMRSDNFGFEKMNEYTFDTNEGGIFQSCYMLVYRANMVINKFAAESPVKKRVIAEAKVFRALAYFDLVTYYGGVPLVLGELAPSEYQQPNSNVADLWKQIESDLNDALAEGALPVKADVNDSQTTIRLTQHAALALLGKAQLFQKKYAEAAASLQQLIHSGKYALYPDYELLFRSEAEFNCESVMETNYVNDPSNPFGQGVNLILGANWRVDRMDITQNTVDIGMNGYGFDNPTKNLYDAFVAEEGAGGYRLNNTIKTYEQVVNDMKITIKPGQFIYGHEGYFRWKFFVRNSDFIPNSFGFSAHNNAIKMRYAEVLLMASEACLLSGDQANADNYLNEVRQRAKLPAKHGITLEDIKIEKRLELCFEGTRFPDLIRWGDAAQVLANQGARIPSFLGFNEDGTYLVTYREATEPVGFKAGRHELLPIPQTEILRNKNINQNPGW
jgi:hypothetical protein